MSDDVYLKLREYLDKLPGSYPTTESGIEMKILKKLFTPEQATITLQLGLQPNFPADIAQKLNMDEKEAAEKLEAMAKEGLILRARIGDTRMYMPASFVVGIYEFHLNTLDHEFVEMFEEYFPYLVKSWETHQTKQLRVVPIESSITNTLNVSTYDHVRELIKDKELIGIAECICAKEQEMLGNPCSRPKERCIMFDMAADYYIENGLARKITRDELMETLKLAEDQALVLSPSNSKLIFNFCLCCDCCCGWLRSLRMMDNPAKHVHATYLARIDPDICTACGTCIERCQLHAIKELDDVSEVEQHRCIGCGLCVPTCPVEAVSMEEKTGMSPVPNDPFEMQMRIFEERGIKL